MVRYLIVNQKIGGSNPLRGAKKGVNKMSEIKFEFNLLCQHDKLIIEQYTKDYIQIKLKNFLAGTEVNYYVEGRLESEDVYSFIQKED